MKLIAVDKTGSSLCLIDAGSLKVLKRLPMPLASHDFVSNAAKDRIFVSIYGGGVYGDNPEPGHEVIIVDPIGFETIGAIDTAPYTAPHGLTFDHKGVLWVTCDAHSSLIGIDTETGLVRHVVGTRSSGTHWALTSVFTGYLYTSNKQDSFLSVIDPTQVELKGMIDVPNGSEGICFSADGKLLYVADHQGPYVLVIDAVTMAIVRTIELVEVGELMKRDTTRTTHHMRVSVSADGMTLAVAAYHFDRLVLVHLADPKRQVTLKTGHGPVALAFHPADLDRLYFSNHDEGTIGVVDLRLEKVILTVDCGGGIEAMRFM